MSFFGLETSRSTGQPLELYEFTYGAFVYRYNTTASEVVVNNLPYKPMPLAREAITLTNDIRRSQLTITAPINFEVASFFRASIPASPILVTIKKKHRNDPEVITEWIGRIITAEWQHSGVKLFCESYYTAIQGNANMRYYGYACPHMLFGDRCKLSRITYRMLATVSAVSGTNVTSPTFATKPNRYFVGGYLVFDDGTSGIQHKRFISAHTGNTITLANHIPELTANRQVEVYPGCDHTLATCRDKFNNHVNFGGFPWIPGRNPFTTSSSIFW
jgi:uncharacterized phage protein (TIGR02218 family)